MKVWHIPVRWEQYQQVKYREILSRWPQLTNWRFIAPSIPHHLVDIKQRFNILVRIARNISPEETIRCKDIIPLIVEFGVKDWPREEEVKRTISWKDLTPAQRERFKFLAYWHEVNNKPLNPKRHARISHAYTSVIKNRSKI
jgi:hypothetical protein